MKLRISAVITLMLAAGAGFVLFQTSQDVQQAEDRLGDLRSAMAKESEAVRVLETEWDYLNRPDRLEELAAQYLKIQVLAPQSLVRDSSRLPEPDAPVIPLRKPVFVSQHASAEKPRPAEQAAPPMPAPVTNDTRQQFQNLLSDLTAQEPAAGDAP